MKSKKITFIFLRYILGINTPARLLKFLAKRKSDKIIFEQYGQQLTFSDFNSTGNKLANALKGYGLRKGDIVTIWSKNRREYIEIRLACYKLGLVFCAFIDDFDENTVAEKLQEFECKVFFFDTRGKSVVQDLLPDDFSCQFISLDSDGSVNSLSYNEFHKNTIDTEPSCKVKPKDICAIGFTSGTTGNSKGVVWDNRAWIYSFYHFMLNSTPVSGEMKMLQFIPFSTAGSLSILPWLASGGNMLLAEDFHVEEICKTITEQKVTNLLAAPAFLIELCDFYENNRNKYDLSSLKSISVGSAAMPGDKLEKTIAAFGPVIIQSYGMSECLAPISSLQIADVKKQEKYLISVGKPVQQVKLDIENANQGHIGPISIKSKTCALGYWAKDGLITTSFKKNRFYTDDLGRIDTDGYLYIIDRAKNVYQVGDKTFYSRIIEEELHRVKGIKQVSIILNGQIVQVFFTQLLQQKVDLDKLNSLCTDIFKEFNLAYNLIEKNSLPVSSSGKILRSQLFN